MDPLSITTTVFALCTAVEHLITIGGRYKDAGKTIAGIKKDCNKTIDILEDYQRQLTRRRSDLEESERVHSKRLECSLKESCNDLIKDISKLRKELERVTSPPKTKGDLVLSHVRQVLNLYPLQKAHAAVKEKIEYFEQQQVCLDSSRPSTPQNKAPLIIDLKARQHGAKLLRDAIRANKYQTVVGLLEEKGLDPNFCYPLDGGASPLILATSIGHKPMVELLLLHQAGVSSRDDQGRTALHIASINNNADIVELLLREADPAVVDLHGHTPLWYAANGKHTSDAFKKLLLAENTAIDESQDDKLPTPLWAAAAGGHRDRILALLEKGADIDSRDEKDRTLLHRIEWPIAATLTKLLLDHGANPWVRDSPRERLPLHRAADEGRIDIVAMLLNKMVEPQGCSKADAPNVRDGHGMTPLMCAALRGSMALVLYLIRTWGADFDLQDKLGNDAFYCACAKGHLPIVIYLLGLGADINRVNNEGNTPLHIAATQGQEAIVELLLQIGANTEAKSTKIGKSWVLENVQRSGQGQILMTPAAAARLSGYEKVAKHIDAFVQQEGPEDWTLKISTTSCVGS
ncbi:hypothetical protein ACHAP5_009556 [Fusarium lateritium]